MKYIIFQKFSINHLFFLLFCFVSISRKILTYPIFGDDVQKSGYFFINYLTVLSHLLNVIPYLIIKYRSKRVNKKEEDVKTTNLIENNITYNYYDKEKSHKSKSIVKNTLLVSIFDFSGDAIIFLFYFLNNDSAAIEKYSLKTYLIFNTVVQYIASYLILKTYFYKHHYLSFGINFFCILISLIIDIVKMIENSITDYQYYLYIIIRLIRVILFAFGDSYSKRALLSEFLSPYSLLLFKALYEIIFLLIFSIPFIFIKAEDLYVNNESIFLGFKEYLTGIKILYSFLLFVIDFLYDLFLMLLIDKFSPSHLTLAFFLDALGYNIFHMIKNSIEKKNNDWSFYIIFVVYIILFVGAMIHNEVFIINKCGLNENTKLFLDYKFNREKLDNKNLIPEDDNDDDENTGEKTEENGCILEDKTNKIEENY